MPDLAVIMFGQSARAPDAARINKAATSKDFMIASFREIRSLPRFNAQPECDLVNRCTGNLLFAVLSGFRSSGITCRVGKGALFAPCPPGAALVGTLRFAHPTTTLPYDRNAL